jgi:hypothetical protein
MKLRQISEGQIDELFGFGRKTQAVAEPEPQPEPQPEKKGFQFSQQDFQNADSFVNTILRQINGVLGPAYIGRLNQVRGGIPNFKKALKHFWGRAAGTMRAGLQDVGSQSDLTPQIVQIADRVIQA